MPRPRPNLKFKYRGQEFVFRRDSVHNVALLRKIQVVRTQGVDLWQVKVDGYIVFEGSEPACHRQYERALRYL